MSESEYISHYSVMLPECLDHAKQAILNITKPIVADMTFGGGGHTCAFAGLSEDIQVYSVDQDPDALQNGKNIISKKGLEDKINLLNMNFESFPQWVLENHPEMRFHSILLDLGVSSHHFDKFDRGFSFREDAPLDMRMNYNDQSIYTGAEFLNKADEEEIANIIFKYGEERLSRRIARGVVEFRQTKPIETTKELENIVFHAYPARQRHGRIHPATKTFQAIRIFVNRELEVLENTLEKLYDLLAPNGVLQVISFHSLEDRITKHKFKEIFQCNKNTAKILTKKPIYPSEREITENSRSRSAKLRVMQRL